MLRRSTLFALVVLAGLIAFALYLGRSKNSAVPEVEATPTADSYALFGPEEGQPNLIQIASASQGTVEIARGADGGWTVNQPVEGSADASRAEAAATQLSALRVLSEVQVAAEDAGLANPAYSITAGFTGGARHKLEIGDMTPSMGGYYARLDGGSVLIIEAPGIQSLIGMVTAPPYSETPTPSPVPATETTVPAAGAGTPESLPVTATP
jgi:hypothetical protein